ncbi:uncharacterized protein LOC110450231 isoform X2 [Mizuhopecten yessoensis]|uniref:uncharacterized protein LOC110450231 isoform X2 n=1 Tax=Mizuhopecten yessoensis TaxID=6573 RepID=UPI000B4591DC|nr:uncharacterized protein LOC110450231 isoform X2 [Mizuhopecten yessoensis]
MEEEEYHLQNGNNNQCNDDPDYPRAGHCRMDRRRTSYAYRAVLAVENVARRMSVPSFTVDTIAQNLEEEIERDSEDPKGNLEKIRRSGEQILHNKKVLLMIVVLNILDCALVLGELILDIHFIKEMVHEARGLILKFTRILLEKFPAVFTELEIEAVSDVFNRLIGAMSTYNQTADVYLNLSSNINGTYSYRSRRSAEMAGMHDSYFTQADIPAFMEADHKPTLVEDLAHAFHKASIIILGILVLMLFDGFIVVTSFVIDIAFIKGIMGYPLEDAVATLAFLIPWRVIRVANSLVMAVMDEAHLQLKMIYTEKKIAEDKHEESESNLKYQKNVNKILRDLCLSEGIPMSRINEKTAGCEMPLSITRLKKRKHLSSLRKKLNCFTASEGRNSLPYGFYVPHKHLHRKNGIYSVDSYNSSDDGYPSEHTVSRHSSVKSIPDTVSNVIPEIKIQDTSEAKDKTDTTAVISSDSDCVVDANSHLEKVSPGRYRKSHNHVKWNHYETGVTHRNY